MSGKDYIIPSLALMCVGALLFSTPIPQDQNYHNFADQRMAWGIPNFLNVITNLPFAIVGLLGVQAARKVHGTELKHISYTLFTGFLLVAAGSSYYHLLPNNVTLVYDRIPIVIILMSFFALIIHDCISPQNGYKALIILNIIGLISVIYWDFTERTGNGDLRWYGMVQFFPVVAIPLMLGLYRSSFNHWKEIFLIFIFFALAKLTEIFDIELYHILRETISGHSFKHLLMSASGYEMVILLRSKVRLHW